jgi:hypothetical protein
MSFESTDPADVIDAQDARLEIYIRMNDDSEKDYCFSVGINDTFESLLKVFDTLKLSLRPSAFYEQRPIGFQVSTQPGLLTDSGGLLFSDDAHKFTREVKLTDKISDFAWPGQLVLPVWKDKKVTKYAVASFLAFWLYTDLPDYYSPTPGLALTNQIARIVGLLLHYFELHDLAEDILAETVPNKLGYTPQLIFFTIHVLKVVFIYLVFWSGLFNPYSFNPATTYNVNKTEKLDEAKKEQLIAIGWTGSRRGTLEEYRDFIKDFEIKKAGGIVKASKLGLFDKLRNPVIRLQKGEGFDSDIKNKLTLEDLEKDPSKIILTYDFIGEIGEAFEDYLSTQSTDVNKDIKNFRKYGPFVTSERISKIIEARKAFIPGDDAKDSTEKKNE